MSNLPPIEIDPDTFLRKHFTLPALPEVVTKIQNVIERGDANMAAVADLINGEPSLVAQVLKVVNSAYYGLPREITNMKYALAFLGLNEVYRMVLSLSVVNTIAIDKKAELDRFWTHSFYTALTTKYLAKKYEPHLSFEELWSASILHDIGKLVYLKFFPDHYHALLQHAKKEGVLFSTAEIQMSLPSSGYLGSLLARYWRLPEHIEKACKCHSLEDLERLEEQDAQTRSLRIICLGNLIASLSSEELNDTVKHEIASTTKALLGCDESEFLTLMGDIYELEVEVERFVSNLH
jgi:HD-like signal output (HDOD) protein